MKATKTMRKASAVLIGSLATLGGGAVAHASCITVQPAVINEVRLDPLAVGGPGQLLQPFSLIFNRATAQGEPLTVHYQIVDEDSVLRARVGASSGPAVEFQSRDTNREATVSRHEGFTPLRAGRVVMEADHVSAQAELFLRLTDLREDMGAGVYREGFTVRYWCDADNPAPYEAAGVILATVVVPNVISANIAGASASGEIDFLDFALPSRRLQVSVRSTGPFEVTARSLNGGALLREGAGPAGDAADQVRYQAWIDGRPLSLSGSNLPFERAGMTGRLLSLDVEVESVADKRAGAYADTLLLTLTPAN